MSGTASEHGRRAAPRGTDAAAPARRAGLPGLASVAATLAASPKAQRLADQAAAMNARARTGTLAADQVAMPRREQDLPAGDVGTLTAMAASLRRPGGRPIADALRTGVARVEHGRVALPGIAPARGGASGLARSLAALRPTDLSVSAEAGRYAVHARMNPWIEVVGGKIQDAQNGPVNKHMPNMNWVFVAKQALINAGLNPNHLGSLIGKSWPPGAAPGGYTMPSVTFSSTPKSTDFHALTPETLPGLPGGHAWHRNVPMSEWEVYRDPAQAPSSPKYDVTEGWGPSNNYFNTASIEDLPAPDGRRPLSGYAQIPTHNYTGARSYPMTSDDYEDANGTRHGRGHIVDHAVGTHVSTTSSSNYTPQDRSWNEGARNHLVRTGDHGGGGYYREDYTYSANLNRTANGAAVPDSDHFMITDGGGAQQYFDVPMDGSYGTSRSLAHANTFSKPPNTFPFPNHF